MIYATCKNWTTGGFERREYTIREQRMIKCIRDSGNGYWETPQQMEERGVPRAVESEARYTLIEKRPTGVNFVEYFAELADITQFFKMIRAQVYLVMNEPTGWMPDAKVQTEAPVGSCVAL
jgi:hypothetical protein